MKKIILYPILFWVLFSFSSKSMYAHAERYSLDPLSIYLTANMLTLPFGPSLMFELQVQRSHAFQLGFYYLSVDFFGRSTATGVHINYRKYFLVNDSFGGLYLGLGLNINQMMAGKNDQIPDFGPKMNAGMLLHLSNRVTFDLGGGFIYNGQEKSLFPIVLLGIGFKIH